MRKIVAVIGLSVALLVGVLVSHAAASQRSSFYASVGVSVPSSPGDAVPVSYIHGGYTWTDGTYETPYEYLIVTYDNEYVEICYFWVGPDPVDPTSGSREDPWENQPTSSSTTPTLNPVMNNYSDPWAF